MGKKYIIIAQKGDEKIVRQFEPKLISIHELQDHLMTLGVAITFTDLDPQGTKYYELGGTTEEGEPTL